MLFFAKCEIASEDLAREKSKMGALDAADMQRWQVGACQPSEFLRYCGVEGLRARQIVRRVAAPWSRWQASSAFADVEHACVCACVGACVLIICKEIWLCV